MTIPESHMKERLHRVYVNAVASRAGAKYTESLTDYGLDVTIQDIKELPNGKFVDTGILFHCQLKATTKCELKPLEVIYDMEVEAYNKLVTWEGGICILVLFNLPIDVNEWLHLDEEKLLLKKCCYWSHITGPISENSHSQRIMIPRIQQFTPDTVKNILNDIRLSALS